MEPIRNTHVRSLPESLRAKLLDFRRGLRTSKVGEVVLLCALVTLASWLVVFAVDRFVETWPWVRAAALLTALAGLTVLLPLQVYRWVVRVRSADDMARVIARRDPAAGDRVLGVIELTRSESEFDRSPVLCDAAVRQVDDAFRDRDFASALPTTRRRLWARALVLPGVFAIAVFAVVPDAGVNALARWIMPFGEIERFTFARTDALPDDLWVARGEPFTVRVGLAEETRWSPASATAAYGDQDAVATELADGAYVFEFPGQTVGAELFLRVGDVRHRIDVHPIDRPAIAALDATVGLPGYLGIAEPRIEDGRSGRLAVVRGSTVNVRAEMTRAIASAAASGRHVEIDGAVVRPAEFVVEDADVALELAWTDVRGLAGGETFDLTVRAVDDEPPVVYCDGLKHEAVLLETETLEFNLRASDDFGARRVGISWRGVLDRLDNPEPSVGEKLLAAGAPDQTDVAAMAAFCPKTLGIGPQKIELRGWVEDALPGRERVHTNPVTLFILDPEQHMIWVTAQLDEWLEQAVEVRDRELELYEANKELRALPARELDLPANRRKLQSQARSERANSRRLTGLVGEGQKLLTQAARNPQFNSNTMDDWAEMLRTLENIAARDMPSVADLLVKAASAPRGAAPSKAAPTAGVTRDQPKPGGAATENRNELPQNPSVQDVESSFNQGKKPDADARSRVSNAPPAPLRMPVTVVMGGGPEGRGAPADEEPPPPAETLSQEELDRALAAHRKLLEEFSKVAGKINEILANLQGSTFVKRLKAESRGQTKVAKDLVDVVRRAFGASEKEMAPRTRDMVGLAVDREERSSESVSLIQEDLGAYVDRLEGTESQGKFRTVLDEMKELSVSRELREVAADARVNLGGDALAHAEYWSDTLDRWAEQLVGPG